MSDWTNDAANAIDNAVGLVRDRTVEPVLGVARAITYGLLAVLVLLPALVLLTIAAFRLLAIASRGHIWIPWCGIGGIFVIAGWFCWSKRNP